MNGATEVSRRGSSFVPWLIGAGILTLLVLLLLPAFHRGSPPYSRHMECAHNLKNIALALHNYESVYGVLPPAYTVNAQGRPLHSWRTLILPYCDQVALYRTIDLSKPWDDPVNAAARATTVRAFSCPLRDDGRSNLTPYMVVAGRGTCFPPGESCSFKDIKDGMANTLLVVEVPAHRAVQWMEPVDFGTEMLLDLSKDTPLPHRQGANVAFADGKVRTLSQETVLAQRKAMLTIAGDEETGVDNP